MMDATGLQLEAPDYAELHCLSSFSFQRGASHAEELVRRAQELGYHALAVTDECSLAGIVRAHVAAKAAHFKLIVGAEFALVDGLRLLLLAPERNAYGDLCELISRGRRNAEKGEYRLTRDDVAEFASHLLAIWLPPPQPELHDADWLRAQFADRAWLAVELLHGAGDAQRLAQLQWLAQVSGLPALAAGDVHMHARSRRALQDVMTSIRLNKPVAECGLELHGNGERHLRSRPRLASLYPPEMLAETVRVAERCTLDLDTLRYEYPAELVPEGKTPGEWLRELVNRGLKTYYRDGIPLKVREQVEHELTLIIDLAYEPYFLTVWDVVTFARSQNILCQGRGSAANSAVCFALGITSVDPARSELLFERFISRERGEPPDIDVDFEHDRREIVIQYLYQKYTRDRAALAATVITYRPKSAVRDVGRALGLAEDQLDRLSRTLSWWDKRAELPLRLVEAGLDPDGRTVKLLLSLVEQLLGFPRHLSQHVGGFVISRGPLCRLVPIENAAMVDRTIIQWDKDDLDAMKLLKVDVLALGMLSAIRRTFDLVHGWRGKMWTLASLPKEDPRVYDMICQADTIGVFQIESRAQMSMLPRMKPRTFYDLVIEVAIVRPGPIQGGMVHPYLKRRQGQEPLEEHTPAVDQVLRRTLGIPIFQEQVMKLAEVAAGFSPGEADDLRRAMAAWKRSGKLALYKQKLFDGMLERGYTEEFANRIYKQIEGFSEYGFPESHAASFASLVYVSAWLKCFEPAAFLCGMLNSLPMGFYSASQLIQDARRHGIEVRPADVQHSHWDSTLEIARDGTVEQPAVRLGLRQLDGVSALPVHELVNARPRNGFESVAHLQRLVRLDQRMLRALTEGGAMESLAGTRRQVWWHVSGLDATQDLGYQEGEAHTPALPASTLGEEVVADYQSQHLSLRAHPLALLRQRLRKDRLMSAAEINALENGRPARPAGIVTVRQRPGTAKGVVFVTLEDETGNVNVIIWPKLGELQRKVMLTARLLAVYGVVQYAEGVRHVVAHRLEDRSDLLGELSTRSRDFH
ncbi:error-prone DNA polymerase [Silvimonas sp. JCM 19000]